MTSQPDKEEIEAQQRLLTTHRRTLEDYLQKQAQLESAYTPAYMSHGIREVRDNIRRVKGILRDWGVTVNDHPDDEAVTSEAQQQENPSNIPLERTIKTSSKGHWSWLVFGIIIGVISVVLSMFIIRTPKANVNFLTIEQVLSSVESYPSNRDDLGKAFSRVSLKGVPNNNENDIFYRLEYYMPEQGDYEAGMTFLIKDKQGIDVTGYKYLEFTLITDSDSDEPLFNISLEDVTSNYKFYHANKKSIDASINVDVFRNGNTTVFKIPLQDNFNAINLKVVNKFVVFTKSSDLRGEKEVTIGGIRFIKE